MIGRLLLANYLIMYVFFFIQFTSQLPLILFSRTLFAPHLVMRVQNIMKNDRMSREDELPELAPPVFPEKKKEKKSKKNLKNFAWNFRIDIFKISKA